MLDISPVDRTVTVGPREALAVQALTGSAPRWCGPEPAGAISCGVQLRAHGEEFAGRAEATGNTLRVEFDQPVGAVAPGQAVVLYDGTRVIGSATIDSVERVRPCW